MPNFPAEREPEKFIGKDEDWLQWKETLEDYADAVRPGLKNVMAVASDIKAAIKDRAQLAGVLESEWNLNAELFVLLKRKTTGEAKTLVTSAERNNGLESWRILVSRFEPQVGIKRMKETCELMALQNKRCKNAAETALILLDISRRQKLIAEIGGTPVDNAILVNVLWMSMDPGARSHISSKINADDQQVDFPIMREAVMRHTTLVGATSGASASRPTAMDVGSIASVTDRDQPQPQPEEEKEAAQVDWYGEGGWPAEGEEEAWVEGQLNWIKGKGKGKGACWNCGQQGHQQSQCPNPPSKGKGKGDFKGKGKETQREKAREREARAGLAENTGTDRRTASRVKVKETGGPSTWCAACRRSGKDARTAAVLMLQSGPQAQRQSLKRKRTPNQHRPSEEDSHRS